jgi:hypothetical protein
LNRYASGHAESDRPDLHTGALALNDPERILLR